MFSHEERPGVPSWVPVASLRPWADVFGHAKSVVGGFTIILECYPTLFGRLVT